MKSRRGKKYNPIKGQQSINRYVLKDFYVVYIPYIENGDIMLTTLDGERVTVTHKLANAFTNFKYNWSVYMGVFSLDPFGNNVLQGEIATTKHEVFQTQIVESLNDRHQRIVKRANQQTLCGVGWLATITGRDISEAEAYNIFNKFGAWSAPQQIEG